MDCYELFLLTTLLTLHMWLFHTEQLPNSLQTSVGCPTSQLSCNINYLALAETPQI